MRHFLRITVSALSLASAIAIAPERVQALPMAPGAEVVALAQGAENVAYLFNRRRYCWYALGWRGPGWYRCGYRLRRGYGWGGGDGWQGWSAPMMRQQPGRVGPGMGARTVGRPTPPVGETPRQNIEPVQPPRGGLDRPMGPRPARPAQAAPARAAPVGGERAAPPAAMSGPRNVGPVGQPSRPPAAAPSGGGAPVGGPGRGGAPVGAPTGKEGH